MSKFFSLTLHDPILIVIALIIGATGVILVWALPEYFGLPKRNRSESRRPEQENEAPPAANNPQHSQRENENIILMEAHLREMSNQLSEIGRRLLNVEKIMNQKKAAEQTVPALFNNTEMEKFIQRIESRLELLSSDKSQNNSETISKLESKIDGIHKLLIILTDSGNTDQK